MCTTSSNFSVSSFRRRLFVWIMLTVLLWSFLPSVSLAQQPTATISTVSGTVLVDGQKADKGTVLSAGSVIETQAGATVVLELSDGSLVELGENTKLDLAVLSQTATGGRISRIALLWGRIRAKLSPGHQQAGSSFEIDTPNAAIGVKFSQPDVEVSYDPAKQETVALALTVALAVKNLITDEEKIIPIGSIAIITALGIKVMAGAAATGVIAAGTTSAGATAGTATAAEAAGIGTGSMIAIGAGALAAAGGVAAVAASGGDGDQSGSSLTFTGTFRRYVVDQDGFEITYIIDLVQQDTSVTGTYDLTVGHPRCCFAHARVSVTGDVEGNVLTLTVPPLYDYCSCRPGAIIGGQPLGGIRIDFPSGIRTYTLESDGNLRSSGGTVYSRQALIGSPCSGEERITGDPGDGIFIRQ